MCRNHLGLAGITLLTACVMPAQTLKHPPTTVLPVTQVSAVSGESWLDHLHRSYGDTSMGKTGRLGPGPQEESEIRPVLETSVPSSGDGVTVNGSDLYRLNCRGCHGESGSGAPPEINSVINPVRATSVPLVLDRMKKMGAEMTYSDAAKLANQAQVALLDRLHHGGENMPPFPQLNDAETHALLAYLKQLADVPGAVNDRSSVKESRVRVGELIVKSTCHTCHSAVGPNPGPRELMDGAIPPLSTLTRRKDESEFVRKVTLGALVVMGTPPEPYRGRMPAFYYLTEQEADDVYLYLFHNPPTDLATSSPLVAASQLVPRVSGGGPSSPGSSPPTGGVTGDSESGSDSDAPTLALIATLSFVALAIASGLFFTIHEFKRLSCAATVEHASTHVFHVEPLAARFDAIERISRPSTFSDVKGSSD